MALWRSRVRAPSGPLVVSDQAIVNLFAILGPFRRQARGTFFFHLVSYVAGNDN